MLQHRFSLRFKENVQLKHEIPLGVGLVGYAAQHGEAVLAPDVSKDPRYISANPETRSELVIPLIYKDKVMGVLDIEHTRRNYFNDDHVRILTTMAAQVAIAIENATLYERIARQEKRLEQDLALARELQFRLLPQKMPVFKYAEVASRFAPARQIGGDLYDFLKYSGHGVTGIAVGDVSGKGTPAAIYAALVSGIARSHAMEEPSAAGMLEAINLSLAERPIDGQYVSMIYAIWDDNQQQLQLANSGLPRPLHCRDGKVEEIQATGLPIGLFPHATYDELNLRGRKGDVFLVLQRRHSGRDQFQGRHVWAASAGGYCEGERASQRGGVRGCDLHRRVEPRRGSGSVRRSDAGGPQGERTFQQEVSAHPLQQRPPGFTYFRRENTTARLASRAARRCHAAGASGSTIRHAVVRVLGDDDQASAIASSTRPSAAASTPFATR